ncbi:hypothetical protein JS756_34390 [Streptomyces actuosus]|uniref:Fibronectin type-III domain-containing protein n=1 Tax=Streptomyces actuosus TaxID=1885 RepID=A0ABS2W1C3_STRAS|nr:hypothetical protein [Streptomyces actuosus]MBN0049084.1 hypothetical protein [Streptomyces actuosus]
MNPAKIATVVALVSTGGLLTAVPAATAGLPSAGSDLRLTATDDQDTGAASAADGGTPASASGTAPDAASAYAPVSTFSSVSSPTSPSVFTGTSAFTSTSALSGTTSTWAASTTPQLRAKGDLVAFYAGQVKLFWPASADAAGYRVYRSPAGAGRWTAIATTAATRYTDTTLPMTGASYDYQVHPYDRAGHETGVSATRTITTASRNDEPPAAPKGVEDNKATGPVSQLTLRWDANTEPDLAGYRVYRSTSSTVELTEANLLTTVSSSSYTDEPPQTGAAFSYVVTAVDNNGHESAPSGTARYDTYDTTAPSAPAIRTPDTSGSNLVIKWTAVGGAAVYRVYRATSADGPFSRIAETSQTSAEDTSTTEDVQYFYRVTAVDSAGNESRPSMTISAYGPDIVAPSPVTGVTVTPTEYGFELHWDANPAKDLKGYNIKRGELTTDGDVSVCRLYGGYWVGADATSYAYPHVADGETTCFIVDPYDDDGNSTFETTREAQIVVATALDLRPSVQTPSGSPLRLDASDLTGGYGNSLHWFGLTQADPEQAGGYRVYRWNRETSSYEVIAELPSGTSDFVDKDAPLGTSNFYWVTAVDAEGRETAPADSSVANVPA